ncbi:protein ORF79 [Lake sturgeon herpesvirus]|nr:protein ORF79 [Lake sturgeon herpesvirus]
MALRVCCALEQLFRLPRSPPVISGPDGVVVYVAGRVLVWTAKNPLKRRHCCPDHVEQVPALNHRLKAVAQSVEGLGGWLTHSLVRGVYQPRCQARDLVSRAHPWYFALYRWREELRCQLTPDPSYAVCCLFVGADRLPAGVFLTHGANVVKYHTVGFDCAPEAHPVSVPVFNDYRGAYHCLMVYDVGSGGGGEERRVKGLISNDLLAAVQKVSERHDREFTVNTDRFGCAPPGTDYEDQHQKIVWWRYVAPTVADAEHLVAEAGARPLYYYIWSDADRQIENALLRAIFDPLTDTAWGVMNEVMNGPSVVGKCVTNTHTARDGVENVIDGGQDPPLKPNVLFWRIVIDPTLLPVQRVHLLAKLKDEQQPLAITFDNHNPHRLYETLNGSQKPHPCLGCDPVDALYLKTWNIKGDKSLDSVSPMTPATVVTEIRPLEQTKIQTIIHPVPELFTIALTEAEAATYTVLYLPHNKACIMLTALNPPDRWTAILTRHPSFRIHI